uniref:Cilia- and flagella-associated protein 418 n=1 Tax=Mola mola TaxID=94237 RepID=A0A3Q3VXV0_MOLML
MLLTCVICCSSFNLRLNSFLKEHQGRVSRCVSLEEESKSIQSLKSSNEFVSIGIILFMCSYMMCSVCIKFRCCPVFVGGSSVTNGVGTATSKRSCDQLRCTSCDFQVLIFDDCAWDVSCNYLFLRNNVPDQHKLRAKLKTRRGFRAYACQCSWFSALEPADLRGQPQLTWVCGKHQG